MDTTRALTGFLAIVSATTASAQVTQRASLSSAGVQGDGYSSHPALSADGRYVVFVSAATNLVAGDTNARRDVFVRDLQTGTTERVSVDSAGAQGNHNCEYYVPCMSADGRYVVFTSSAANLVAGDTNAAMDVFLRDRQSGTTERVSLGAGGAEGNNESADHTISADGRYVAFASFASNLVAGDTNARYDVFVRDRQSGTTERVSVDSGGIEANDHCSNPWISADGRYVAFASGATNLAPQDVNATFDVYVHDRQTGTTELVSVDPTGTTPGDDISSDPSVSGDGRYVAFHSNAGNLVAGDFNGWWDVFVRDRQTGTTERASVDSGGGPGWFDSINPWISADGRYVAFESYAYNLVPGDTNVALDILLRDRQSGTTQRVNLSSGGAQANGHSYLATLSADGRHVAFQSYATSLVQADSNLDSDIFVRDRQGAPDFASLCSPGVGGVIACPCSNPPSGLGRGCNNSSNTGGAVLTAAGGSSVSSDSLVFTTNGEKPTALSIVAQWTGGSASGVVFGMGVRCTSGALKRLYTKSAVGGSITAPSFESGDAQVTARSAALGDVIAAGQSRWYLVYYRDATVLGGCPAASTFNATQTGQVTWQP